MKTLIELYDERAIENVIGPETFAPEKVIYLCAPESEVNEAALKRFFKARGLTASLEFITIGLYDTQAMMEKLMEISRGEQDCMLDVTGGTDAAIFAAGRFAEVTGTPAFTYSRKNNRFYNISNAAFAHEVPCELHYTVSDFFMMTGGSMRKGRVDNRILSHYMDRYDPFFKVYLKHRRRWADAVTFMQRISQCSREAVPPLKVAGSFYQKGERGGRIQADPELLRDLEGIGFLEGLRIQPEVSVSFSFKDQQIRTWLRDVGSVLELYMYKACKDAAIFGDVISSAIVDWDGTRNHDSISNEIDVVAARGVVPLFISCKTCEVKTEALNELAILRDRFGGKGAKAAIVTSEYCNAAARHRAAQLGIAVIDREELEAGQAARRLRVIMKVEDFIN